MTNYYGHISELNYDEFAKKKLWAHVCYFTSNYYDVVLLFSTLSLVVSIHNMMPFYFILKYWYTLIMMPVYEYLYQIHSPVVAFSAYLLQIWHTLIQIIREVSINIIGKYIRRMIPVFCIRQRLPTLFFPINCGFLNTFPSIKYAHVQTTVLNTSGRQLKYTSISQITSGCQHLY